MTKSRLLTGIISAVFCLTLVSSARADNSHRDTLLDIQLEKLIFAERHNLTIIDTQRAETAYLYTGHFEGNNGKHRGFSVAALHQSGPRFGLVRETEPIVSATPNPEPTAMVLLGTGLAAAGAFARKLSRRRKV